MKTINLVRLTVASFTAVGCVLVASSQPGRQANAWPKHSMIPANVSLSQVQEFKDASTLHLNDVQQNLGLSNQEVKWTAVIVKTISRGVVTDKFVVWYDRTVGGTVVTAKKLSPAALATLYFTFDQGIDMIARNPKSTATATITPNLITANIKPSDMGVTDTQFHQMVAQYVESHPMRFWNEARVGLASGR